jgi:Zn-dependent protease
MKKPTALSPDDPVTQVGRVFSTPLVVTQDFSRLPLSQVVATAVFYRHYEREHPSMDVIQKLKWALGCMLVFLGSEWCHNLAHTIISACISRPVDAIRVNMGLPLLVYYDPDDPEVAPREHILRAIGGPVFNILTLLPLRISLRRMKPGTPGHFLVRLALNTNLFLSTFSLAPLPFLDGGPILKWSLVEKGFSEQEAETTVQRANGVAAGIFITVCTLTCALGKRVFAAICGFFGLGSLAIAVGWMEDAY